MANPVMLSQNSLIDRVSSREKSLIAFMGEASLLQLCRNVGNKEHIISYYRTRLNVEDLAALTAILGINCLISMKIQELEIFIKRKTGEEKIPDCVNAFEQDVAERLRVFTAELKHFNCYDAIRVRDLELFKRLNKDWEIGLLQAALYYVNSGSAEEREKSLAIVAWIKSQQPILK